VLMEPMLATPFRGITWQGAQNPGFCGFPVPLGSRVRQFRTQNYATRAQI
jgi:hypothetical protein